MPCASRLKLTLLLPRLRRICDLYYFCVREHKQMFDTSPERFATQ